MSRSDRGQSPSGDGGASGRSTIVCSATSRGVIPYHPMLSGVTRTLNSPHAHSRLRRVVQALGILGIDNRSARPQYGQMTKHECPTCDSTSYDPDFEFEDGTGYVCPACDSNVFYISEWEEA